jgi:hypothetical protein
MFQQGINVDFATGQTVDGSRAPTKEQPVWLSRSTVEPLDENPHDFSSQSAASTVPESAAEVVKKVMKENIGTKRQLGESVCLSVCARFF